jgi:hypothetical protein
LLTAFITLENEHLALYVSREQLTPDEACLSSAAPANNRRDVSWDKRRLFFGWLRHSAFPHIRRRERDWSLSHRAPKCSLCFFSADVIILPHISTTEEARHIAA